MTDTFRLPATSSFVIGDAGLDVLQKNSWIFCRSEPNTALRLPDGVYIEQGGSEPQFKWVDHHSILLQTSPQFIQSGSTWRAVVQSSDSQNRLAIELIYQSVDWRQSFQFPKLNSDGWTFVLSKSGFSFDEWHDGPCLVADRGNLVALLPAGSTGWVSVTPDQLLELRREGSPNVELQSLDSGLWFWNSLKKMVSRYYEHRSLSDVICLRFENLGIRQAVCLAALRACFRNQTLAVETIESNKISPAQKRLIENLGAIWLDSLNSYHPQMLPRMESISVQPILANIDEQVATLIARHINKNLDVFPRDLFISRKI
jgi:hypothetical protein